MAYICPARWNLPAGPFLLRVLRCCLNYKDAYLYLVRAVDDLVRYMELSDETADRKTVLSGLRQALSGAEDRAIG